MKSKLQASSSEWWSRMMYAHLLLQEYQKCPLLLNSYHQEDAVTRQKDTPHPKTEKNMH